MRATGRHRRYATVRRALAVLTAATVLTMAGGMFAAVALHAMAAQSAVRIDRLEGEVAQLRADAHHAVVDLAELERPDRVLDVADELLPLRRPDDPRAVPAADLRELHNGATQPESDTDG